MEIVKILMVSRYAGTAVSHFNISNKSEIKQRKACFAPKNLVPLQQIIFFLHNFLPF